MAQTTFDGPVISLGGFGSYGPSSVVSLTAATTLTVAAHAGRVLLLNSTTGFTVTLPAIVTTANASSSGPGNDPNTLNTVGAVYEFWVPATIASGTMKIATNGTDKFVGSLLSVDTDTSGAMVGFTAAATNDNINLNGTTTGGVAGTVIRVVAVAALTYMVTGQLLGSGVVATPFADT